MRLQVVAIGRLKAGPERDLAERYRGRAAGLARPLGIAGPEIVELPEGRARDAKLRRADEATRILDRAAGALLVALDETAPSVASQAFADRLAALRDGGTAALALVIGGPDGLDQRVVTAAGWTLSFGRLTLPHQLVRVLALEQVYRAFTIMTGHPYHREGGPDG